MPPDGDPNAADLAADELQSLSFGSSSRSRSASTATASCSASSSGPLHLPLPPHSATPSSTAAAAAASAQTIPRLGSVSLSDIRFLRRLGAGDIVSVYLCHELDVLAELEQAPRHPVLARSASAFSGQLAELERALAGDSAAASSNPDPAGPMAPPTGCCRGRAPRRGELADPVAEDAPGSPTGSASKKKPAQEGDAAQRLDLVVVPRGWRGVFSP